MAHFCLLVATATRDGVSDALKPFWSDDREVRQQAHFVFVKDEHADIDPSTGRRGYWRNPIGKWDGWTVGGNWHGLLGVEEQLRAADVVKRLAGEPEIIAPVHALLRDRLWREADDIKPWSAAKWRTEIRQWLQSMPADHWITVVDCHC